MTEHAANIKYLTESIVLINEARQGMSMLDQKIRLLRLLENEMNAMEQKQMKGACS